MMKEIKIRYGNGMFNIDGDEFSFSEIVNMYQGGRSGFGLCGTSETLRKEKEENLRIMCFKITAAIKEFEDDG